VRPLVLLVEDNKQNLAARRIGFEERNCAVIAVTNANDAIREIAARHLISLVVMDINLRQDADDVSGLALARYLRDTGRDVVKAGYSAHFAEDDYSAIPLTERDELFDHYYPRSRLKAHEIARMLDELARVARVHMLAKAAAFQAKLELTLADSVENLSDFRSYRDVIASMRAQVEQADALIESDLLLLDPAKYPELRRTVYTICRTLDGSTDLEVFGVPVLYSAANDSDAAAAQLIELMVAFHNDIREFPDLGEPAKELANFLASVLI
jgi:CheY-like chemotaxis protein